MGTVAPLSKHLRCARGGCVGGAACQCAHMPTHLSGYCSTCRDAHYVPIMACEITNFYAPWRALGGMVAHKNLSRFFLFFSLFCPINRNRELPIVTERPKLTPSVLKNWANRSPVFFWCQFQFGVLVES